MRQEGRRAVAPRGVSPVGAAPLDGELMIECHTWGAIDVPEGFREKDVQVDIATNVIRLGDTYQSDTANRR